MRAARMTRVLAASAVLLVAAACGSTLQLGAQLPNSAAGSGLGDGSLTGSLNQPDGSTGIPGDRLPSAGSASELTPSETAPTSAGDGFDPTTTSGSTSSSAAPLTTGSTYAVQIGSAHV